MRQRVLVIGLDGATFDVLLPLVKRGKMPNLKKLIENGVVGELMSVIPPNSCSAWSSFATGLNPGNHGIYEFVVRRDKSYDVYPVNASHRDGKDLWYILSERGMKVALINVPYTYPPRKINGIIITGLGTPSGANFVYPPHLRETIEKVANGYEMEATAMYPEGREKIVLGEIFKVTRKRMKVVRYIMNLDKWDFFMVVFTGTDRLQHALWHFLDKNHPCYNEKRARKIRRTIIAYYSEIDKYIGEIVKKNKDAIIVIVSDHGFAPVYKWLHLNTLLWKMGLLRLKRNMRTLLLRLGITLSTIYKIFFMIGLGRLKREISVEKARRILVNFFVSIYDIDWSKTKVYSLPGVGQIYINLKGREPSGIVNPGEEYEKLVNYIIKRMKNLIDPETGKHVIDKVFRKEEIWYGRHLDKMPDIQLLPKRYYAIFPTFEFSSAHIFTKVYGIYARHDLNGILVMYGPNIKKGVKIERARIIDMAPTILYAMGLKVPVNIDGRILIEAFEESYVKDNPIEYEVSKEYPKEEYTFTEEEEKLVKERLKALGYF